MIISHQGTTLAKMKILYLSYDGMTDPLGQSQVLPYLRGLAAMGHQIHLVSCEKPANYERNKALIQEICDHATIQWFPITYTKNPPVLSTLWDLYRMKRLSKQLHSKHHFNIIHCRSYLTTLIGIEVRKSNVAKILFDMRGFWVDERVEGGIWKLSNPVFRIIYNYLKRKEKEMLVTADAIVSLTNKALPIIKSIQGKTNKGQIIKVIPCCVDTEHFNIKNISALQKKEVYSLFKIPETSFVLSYLGGIGTWYLPSEMMDFFARLLVRFPTALFFFITQEEAQPLYDLAKEKGIPTTSVIVTKATRKEVPLYLSISNASLFFIKPSFSKQASSPTKQGEIMSMGVPLICNKGIGDTDQILIESETGSVVERFDNEEYDRIINELNIIVSEPIHLKIRSAAIHYFSLTDGIKKYSEVYNSLGHE